jgi:hypothetical protein
MVTSLIRIERKVSSLKEGSDGTDGYCNPRFQRVFDHNIIEKRFRGTSGEPFEFYLDTNPTMDTSGSCRRA